jgi:hypothetical protein
LPTAEIDNAAYRQHGIQQWNDLLRRADREGAKEAIEISGVFVHLLNLVLYRLHSDYSVNGVD